MCPKAACNRCPPASFSLARRVFPAPRRLYIWAADTASFAVSLHLSYRMDGRDADLADACMYPAQRHTQVIRLSRGVRLYQAAICTPPYYCFRALLYPMRPTARAVSA